MSTKKHFKEKASIGNTIVSTELSVLRPSTFSKLENEGELSRKRHTWSRKKLLGIYCLWVVVWMLVVVGVGWGFYGWRFMKAAEMNWGELVKLFRSTTQDHKLSAEIKNIVVLGTDSNPGFREKSMLTDVMMMVKLANPGEVKTVSIPRDLWLESLQTRVNSLYFYGMQKSESGGVLLINSAMEEVLGIIPDKYVVVSMESFAKLVDVLGGVEVNVAHELTDNQYPREIDVNSKDPNILYETIHFDKGKQLMGGEQALKYVRSRHSYDLNQGNDIARGIRQQEIVQAIINRVMDPNLIYHPSKLGLIWRWYQESIKTNLTLSDLWRLARTLLITGRATVKPIPIPIGDVDDPKSLLFHPINGPQKQWVYLPVDPSFEKLHEWYEKL